jgi:hypothetical protein
MNTGGTQKVRVKYYQYKQYERKKHLLYSTSETYIIP